MIPDLIDHPTAAEWPRFMLVRDGKPLRLVYGLDDLEHIGAARVWPVFDDFDAALDGAREMTRPGAAAPEIAVIDGFGGMTVAEHVERSKTEGFHAAVAWGPAGPRFISFRNIAH